MAAKGKAEIEITASSARLASGLASARAKFQEFAGATARGIGSAFSKIGSAGITQVTGGNLISGLVGKGTDAIINTANQVREFERNLTRFRINAELSATEAAGFRKEIDDISRATGVSREEVLGAASAYVNFTGNAANARSQLQLFAEVSQATGASMADVASIAATFDKNLHLDPSQYRAAFDVLAKQAHVGGVEMKDLATNFAPVLAQYSQFSGGASAQGLARVSAMAQVLQNMTHNTDETTTALKDMFLGIGKNADKLRALHIDPYKMVNGKKVFRDPLELLDAIAKSPLARDPELLAHVFPEMRGQGALRYLLQELDTVHRIADESERSNQIAKDYATQQESASGRIDKAMNQIKVSLADAFTPERIEAATKALVKFADAAVVAINAIDSLLSSIDVEGAMSKTIEQREVDKAKAQKLTPEQAAKRASDLEAKAAKIDGDDMQSNATRSGFMKAAEDLRKQAQQVDPWIAKGGFESTRYAFSRATMTPGQQAQALVGDSRLGQSILRALEKIASNTKAGTSVSIDGNKVAQAVRSSTHARRGGGT